MGGFLFTALAAVRWRRLSLQWAFKWSTYFRMRKRHDEFLKFLELIFKNSGLPKRMNVRFCTSSSQIRCLAERCLNSIGIAQNLHCNASQRQGVSYDLRQQHLGFCRCSPNNP